MAVGHERPLVERGWRYTLIGIFCALANNVIMIGTDLLGGHYMVGVVLAFLIVTPVAYVLHSWFTFGTRFSLRTFVRFTAGLATAYPVAVLLMVFLCSGLRLPVVIAAPVATIALFVWNFITANWSMLSRMNFEGASTSSEQH